MFGIKQLVDHSSWPVQKPFVCAYCRNIYTYYDNPGNYGPREQHELCDILTSSTQEKMSNGLIRLKCAEEIIIEQKWPLFSPMRGFPVHAHGSLNNLCYMQFMGPPSIKWQSRQAVSHSICTHSKCRCSLNGF